MEPLTRALYTTNTGSLYNFKNGHLCIVHEINMLKKERVQQWNWGEKGRKRDGGRRSESE